MSRLVWVAREGIELLGDPPAGLKLAEFPDDPAGDPRLGEVEVIVPPLRSGFNVAGELQSLYPRMRSLRVIQTVSAGVDWIVDTVPEGVLLCSARGAHDIPVAEWVLAAILAGVKDLAELHDRQREEHWEQRPVGKLAGSTVLLLGYGSIGRAVEERLEPFGPTILRIARRRRDGVHMMDELPELLPRADAVVVLLALTPETAGAVDAAFLRRMRPGALLVNAARGRLVDTNALLEALRDQRVRAVLDVTDPEPLPAGHPLWHAPGALITPHIAGDTTDWLKTVFVLIRAQLERYARGEPLINVVEAGY